MIFDSLYETNFSLDNINSSSYMSNLSLLRQVEDIG